jgi:DNA-binding transcriptional regulator YhcF (GntR family)
LWGFHNAKSGLCFPSYEAIADAAGCARSTVAEAIRTLEDAGLLTWCNRLKRVRERSERFGPTRRAKAMANAYLCARILDAARINVYLYAWTAETFSRR